MTRVLFACLALAASLSPAEVLCDDAFERALSLASEKRYAQAREVLDPLLEREPGHPRARLLHGILRARAGRVSEAIDVFEALRRDHPDMSEPYNNLAVLYAVQGRLEDARRTLVAAAERRPDPVVYANLGDVYAKLARRAYQRARDLDPGGDTLAEQETGTAFALADSPDTASPAESQQATATPRISAPESPGSTTQSQTPAMKAPEQAPESPGAAMKTQQGAAESKDAAQAPREPAPATPEAAAKPRDTVAASGEAVAKPAVVVPKPPTVVAATRSSATETQSPGNASAQTLAAAAAAAPAPDGYCVHAGGFDGRRTVAEAALWLRSYGAEIIEVRHEEQKIASSYRVYLPPLASREEAAEKLREIRRRGVRDVAVIQEGDLANGISFGIYNKAGNVHRRVAALDRLGYAVRSEAEEFETVEDYVIKARAGGAPAALDAAWTSQFPDRSLEVAVCG